MAVIIAIFLIYVHLNSLYNYLKAVNIQFVYLEKDNKQKQVYH